MLHSWPGNVRELRNLLEALFVNHTEGWITPEDLPEYLAHLGKQAGSPADKDRTALVRALQSTSWNKSKAAQELHWSRMTLHRKMAQYQIVSRPRPGKTRERAAAVGKSAK